MSLGHLLGLDGHEWYSFWSGAGADIGQIALVGGAIGLYRRHNCHVHRCWRLGRLPVEGSPWTVCHKHHPNGSPTHADVRAHLADHA